jgi:hypothetical protein
MSCKRSRRCSGEEVDLYALGTTAVTCCCTIAAYQRMFPIAVKVRVCIRSMYKVPFKWSISC